MRGEAPGLLAALSVCGVATSEAPGILRRYLARLPNAHKQDRDISRAELFRGLVKASRARVSRASRNATPSADPDFERDRDFERLPWDLRLALFLLVVLDFSLRESAEILETDGHMLAGRLGEALTWLEETKPRRGVLD
jgi:hypothetical protein